ncbi:MAG TPA: TylF/MycF/NovP-related O-methyltransferase [Lacunisphaera sp.]|nr:TylF/MycF/NovP-related O-methyltransferase [Lacunisphaera sp.]
MKQLLRAVLRSVGLDLVRYDPSGRIRPPPADIAERDRAIVDRISGFTMTSPERQMALIQSVRYLVRHRIEGCMVECGVWRGGSSMATALTLADEGDTGRNLYLYDTFAGMTSPTDVDRARDGTPAQVHLDRDPERKGDVWAMAELEDVRRNMASTGYPGDRVHYIKGPIESTLPAQAPAEPIALLRLDTDWYESTKHELEVLYPRLARHGILIVDDYGHWEGTRKAVDEYFAALGEPWYLHRIDETGRLLVKA